MQSWLEQTYLYKIWTFVRFFILSRFRRRKKTMRRWGGSNFFVFFTWGTMNIVHPRKYKGPKLINKIEMFQTIINLIHVIPFVLTRRCIHYIKLESIYNLLNIEYTPLSHLFDLGSESYSQTNPSLESAINWLKNKYYINMM